MKTAICIASGPSLTQADVDYCRGKGRIYAVNDSYKMGADVLYAADESWWNYHKGCPDFTGEKWCCSPLIASRYPNIGLVQTDQHLIWSETQGLLATGGNSGFQVANLAELHGHERILLLGYNMQRTGGKKHWFGDHHAAIDKSSNYAEWVKRFEKAAPLIKATVINCTPDSALNCFPKIPLREVL